MDSDSDDGRLQLVDGTCTLNVLQCSLAKQLDELGVRVIVLLGTVQCSVSLHAQSMVIIISHTLSALLPSLFCKSMSAPDSIRIPTTSVKPLIAAREGTLSPWHTKHDY